MNNTLEIYNKMKIKTPYHKWIKRIIEKFDTCDYYFKEIDMFKHNKPYKIKVYFVNDKIKDLIIATKLFKKPKDVPNTLYILKHKGIENFYKIGVTSNMDRRIKQLNIASPLGIEVIKTFNLSDHALNMEHTIHIEYDKYRLNGEWFNLTDKQVNDLIESIYYKELNYIA